LSTGFGHVKVEKILRIIKIKIYLPIKTPFQGGEISVSNIGKKVILSKIWFW
jgi:hypothetical protein